MTIDITKLFARLSAAGPNQPGTARCYSASRAELGEDAARITWENCRRDGTAHLRELTDAPVGWDDLNDAVRDYAASFGVWDRAEIGRWPQTDLHAFLLQDIASAVREWDRAGGWEAYREQVGAGTASGRLHCDPETEIVTYTIDS